MDHTKNLSLPRFTDEVHPALARSEIVKVLLQLLDLHLAEVAPPGGHKDQQVDVLGVGHDCALHLVGRLREIVFEKPRRLATLICALQAACGNKNPEMECGIRPMEIKYGAYPSPAPTKGLVDCVVGEREAEGQREFGGCRV